MLIYFLQKWKRKTKELKQQENHKNENSQEDTNRADINISMETEDRILCCLQKFENQKAFLDKETSLYRLSNQFECNTKYLSFVVKKHKNKSFTQYINDLRIQYVLDKLKTDPTFSKYKIYHLSEISGFSSQRAFTLAFINNTHMKPLEYIKKINNS